VKAALNQPIFDPPDPRPQVEPTARNISIRTTACRHPDDWQPLPDRILKGWLVIRPEPLVWDSLNEWMVANPGNGLDFSCSVNVGLPGK
jgi:hypothetical protein